MEKKLCKKCTQEVDKSLFSKNKRNKDGLFNWCKPCMAKYEKDRYHKGDKERKLKNKIKTNERAKTFVWNYLKIHPCVDCGESNPIVLEFDHTERITKEYNISCMMDLSVTTIKREIDKCVVRCANCHRIKTSKEMGYWKSIID